MERLSRLLPNARIAVIMEGGTFIAPSQKLIDLWDEFPDRELLIAEYYSKGEAFQGCINHIANATAEEVEEMGKAIDAYESERQANLPIVCMEERKQK